MLPSNFKGFVFIFLLLLTIGFSIQKVQAQCYQPMYLTVQVNGKYGGADQKTGKVVIPAIFNHAYPFRWPYLKVANKDEGQNTIWGLANDKGELVLPIRYNAIAALECSYFLVREGKILTLLDANFKPLYETDADWLTPYQQFNRVVEGRKLNDTLTEITLRDFNTKKVYYRKTALSMYPVQQRYGKGGSLHRNLPFLEVRVQNAKKTYKASSNTTTTADEQKQILDLTGKVLFDSLQFLDVYQNQTLMRRNNFFILADSTFKVNKALSYKYSGVQPLVYPAKWFMVSKGPQTGVADKTGKIVVPIAHDGQFSYLGGGAFLFRPRDGSHSTHLFFTDGRILDLGTYKVDYGADTTFQTKPIIVRDERQQKSGLISYTGTVVQPVIYDALRYSTNGLVVFVKGDSSGFIDQTGKVLFRTNFKGLSPFYEGYAAAAYYDGRPGFPCATVTSQIGKPSYATLYTFIDSTGKPFPYGGYEQVGAFRNGIAMVVVNCVTFMIDKKGESIKYGNHYLITHFKNDVALIIDKRFKKLGLVHISGKILAEPVYDKIETEIEYLYPNTITFGINAYSSNLRPFTFVKLTDGKAEATIKDKKQYSEKKMLLEIKP